MATRIRLARGGAKKRPFYRIVIADSRAPRDGRYIEKVGTYNPLLPKGSDERVVLKTERIQHWLGQGALPSERVEGFLVAAKLMTLDKKRQRVLDARIKKSEEIKKQKEAEAKKKAEEEAKRLAEEEAQKKAEEEAAAAEQEAAEAPAEEAPAEEAPAEQAEAPAEEAPAEEKPAE